MFIKLQAGQQVQGKLVNPVAQQKEGQWGMQYFYNIAINGEEQTLALSEKSPARKDIESMQAGSDIVVKKVALEGGKSTWVVVPAGDISLQIPSKENFQEFIDKKPEMIPNIPFKRTDTGYAIAVQSARKDSCLLLAGKGTPDMVLECANSFLKWYEEKIKQHENE